MKVVIIDNYDSFTYNLYQYAGEVLENSGLNFTLDVIRNDEKSFEEIRNTAYERIIISPGPGSPALKEYFGVCSQVIFELGKTVPVLGVCLGMQGIAHVFGGHIIKAHVPMHGKTSQITHDEQGVFHSLPQQLEVMRYHSLVADPSTIPSELKITAWCGDHADGSYEIMGLRHIQFPIEGIQFHPESFGTEGGMKMLANFLLNKNTVL